VQEIVADFNHLPAIGAFHGKTLIIIVIFIMVLVEIIFQFTQILVEGLRIFKQLLIPCF
jgi:hypothetical protein